MMHATLARKALPALLVAAFMALAMPTPAAANHPQTDSGRIIAFDHVAGNEWWVEVALSGQDAGAVVTVEAQDTGGPWTPLQKKSWGPYAASFRIEPGHDVRFRASWAGGAQQVSCWFTHPAGAERCPAQAAWNVNLVGDGASEFPAGHDLAIGDVDQDGRNELYLASPQGLWQFAWTSDGWTRSATVAWRATEQVAVGDITGDGVPDLFASGPAGFEGRQDVLKYEWDGQAWNAWSMHTTDPGSGITSMLVADVEGDGRADLYFGTTLPRSLVMQIEFEAVDGFNTYRTRYVLPFDRTITALGAGDPDNDGDVDLGVGLENGDLARVDLTENTGEMTYIGNAGPGAIVAIAIGDGQADGTKELYAASGRLTRWVGGPAAFWPMTELPVGGLWSPMDLAIADADNSGVPELLVAANDGTLYRMQYAAQSWTANPLATADIRGYIGLAVGDGDGDGLREAYMAGARAACCTTPPINPVVQVTNHAVPPRPAPAWHESLIGDAGGRSGESDIAVGDGDRDGKREVYVAARHGLYQFEWTGAAWQRTQLSAQVFHRVAVGDADRDGRAEVYASGHGLNGGYEVLRFTATGTGTWTTSQVHASSLPVGTMTVGDVDDDGTQELYIAMMPEFGGDVGSMPSYQLEFEGGSWQIRYMANVEGGARSSWIGDADRDGDRDWYVVGAAVHRLDITTAGAGSSAFIGGDLPGEDNWLNGIVAGDGDRDGRSEVYVGFTRTGADTIGGGIYRFAPRTGGWDRTTIEFPGYDTPRDLALGDVDNDGTTELYASATDGGLWRISPTASGWALRKVADVGAEMGIDLAIGDADGDGRPEAYMTAFDTSRSPPQNVYRLAPVPPPVTFDATFTGVRGNEWWIQANVDAAGGTLSKVDVRLNGGAWQPLAKQSWGGWAASYRAVQGTTVQLRATATSGATDLSDCYRWIPPSNTDAAIVACGGATPTFDAQFSGVKGNSWWVEAKVTGNQAIAGVEARVNCTGSWRPLTLRDWGAWAASFNVPSGAKVDFRARSTTGATDLSAGYIWPQATATTAC